MHKPIVKKIFQDIYGSESVKIFFDVSKDVAIERLGARIRRYGFFRISEYVMVGAVRGEVVKIQRSSNFVTNSFRPVFFGRFDSESGKTILTGHFRISRLAQIFTTFWFLAIMLLALTMAMGPIIQSGLAWSSLSVSLLLFSAGVLLCACGIGTVKFGTWISYGDRAWLIKEIKEAINSSV